MKAPSLARYFVYALERDLADAHAVGIGRAIDDGRLRLGGERRCGLDLWDGGHNGWRDCQDRAQPPFNDGGAPLA